MDFVEWLKAMGCHVTVTQEDDGSGYIYIEVITPAGPLDGEEKAYKISVDK